VITRDYIFCECLTVAIAVYGTMSGILICSGCHGKKAASAYPVNESTGERSKTCSTCKERIRSKPKAPKSKPVAKSVENPPIQEPVIEKPIKPIEITEHRALPTQQPVSIEVETKCLPVVQPITPKENNSPYMMTGNQRRRWIIEQVREFKLSDKCRYYLLVREHVGDAALIDVGSGIALDLARLSDNMILTLTAILLDVIAGTRLRALS